MRDVTHIDEHGRKFRVRLPDEAGDDQSHLGIPVGPPDNLDNLGLPKDMTTRLHNRLFDMELLTMKDVRRNPQMLFGAMQHAYQSDVQKLQELYFQYSQED